MSVQLISALTPEAALPYPNSGADYIAEAVNSYVLWDVVKAQLIGHQPDQFVTVEDVVPIPGQLLLEAGPSTNPRAIPQNHMSYGPTDEYYFKLRENWSNVDVVLLSKIEGVPIAEGIIFRPFAKSCIDGLEVGEQFAGVLVVAVIEDADPILIDRDLPNFYAEGPRTMRWPILQLKVVSNGAILGHLYKAFVDSDTRTPPGEEAESAVKKKRSYNSSKRMKPDSDLQQSRAASRRKQLRCSLENVNEALTFPCPCTANCMMKVSQKDVLDERTFFYNEPFAKRVEYILSKFDHPEFSERQNDVRFRADHTTLFAKASLKTFFEQTAEPLPHIECKNDATDGITYRLSKAYSRDDVYNKIREKMVAVNMSTISKAAFENIWKKDFLNYGIHNSSAFAKCAQCIYFMNMLHRERRSAQRAKWEHQREMHLKLQMSGRTVYYTHMELSSTTPNLYLSFIHDAMDHSKTIIPRLTNKVKSLMDQVQSFPLKVVGILNHGHEPGVVAHVSVSGLWPSDPNYTISSIAKQLRDYENYHFGSKIGDLAFREPASHELFSALLDEDVFNTTVLRKVSKTYEEFFSTTEEEASSSTRSDSTTRMLPPNLYIQLDNSGKDNKNWPMMAFCSELVARGCCKTVTMSFLMVGHTHEDVDAFFSKVNVAQGGKNIESLPHFLAEVFHAQNSKAYPRVIQEVADYKKHVENHVVHISGQSSPVSFRFYMRDNIPSYQVQVCS
ncbi:hypothetical protein R1sor_008495 [Riccia sorocarpa]|uniref:DUF7869 domain-containing protein n=1 Tax=Riccia sorocarpa TaxID=122646 RepID=A0ABD3HX14_9MARC